MLFAIKIWDSELIFSALDNVRIECSVRMDSIQDRGSTVAVTSGQPGQRSPDNRVSLARFV